jgi:hypothetical protein
MRLLIVPLFGTQQPDRAFSDVYPIGDRTMAKESKSTQSDVKRAMHKRKEGTLKSGRSGKTVKSKKQAIAIGLSEARAKGKKVPARKTS